MTQTATIADRDCTSCGGCGDRNATVCGSARIFLLSPVDVKAGGATETLPPDAHPCLCRGGFCSGDPDRCSDNR